MENRLIKKIHADEKKNNCYEKFNVMIKKLKNYYSFISLIEAEELYKHLKIFKWISEFIKNLRPSWKFRKLSLSNLFAKRLLYKYNKVIIIKNLILNNLIFNIMSFKLYLNNKIIKGEILNWMSTIEYLLVNEIVNPVIP